GGRPDRGQGGSQTRRPARACGSKGQTGAASICENAGAAEAGGEKTGLMMPVLRISSLLLTAGLALLPADAARAQLGTGDSGSPLNIQADNSIEGEEKTPPPF